mgnify:CR=1
MNVLHDIYHVAKGTATDIASNWEYGPGSALTLFDVQTFREIFGPEAGALMYHYIASNVKSPPGSTNPAHGQQRIEAEVKKDLFGLRTGGRRSDHVATVALQS